MFLTYQLLPFWIMLISSITFLALRHFDTVDLNEHREKMGGYPPVICCAYCVIPFAVLICYGIGMKLGPKASRSGIKM